MGDNSSNCQYGITGSPSKLMEVLTFNELPSVKVS